MKNIFIVSILLLSFSGCESAVEKEKAQAERDAQIIKKARADLMAELKAKDEAQKKADMLKNNQLSQVGISVHENEITLNPEKAKDFLNNIGKNLEEKLLNITKDLDKGMIEGQETGIQIDNTKINIDLNKTQDFLNAWGKKMQSFVKEMDNMAKQLDTQVTQ